jgi:transposase
MAGNPGPENADRLIRRGDRNQQRMHFGSLDEQVPEDHRVRIVDEAVSALDLRSFYAEVQSRARVGGRPAHDPAVLLSVWLVATLDGVGSARELSRLVDESTPYRWLACGEPISYHVLASFRTQHVEQLDRLLTQLVAGLVSEGLVTMERVAQDGMKVRASAGADSFHRQVTLAEALAQAEAQVAALRQELANDSAAGMKRKQAARMRAARERQERVAQALARAKALDAERKDGDGPGRASSTDPEARVMKQPDGGFRPSYNVQLATDTQSQIIVGVAVTSQGGDLGQAAPMHAQVRERTGVTPTTYLVDGGYTKLDDIEAMDAAGTTVLAPVPQPRDPTRDRHAPRPGDAPAIARWRVRMGEAASKVLYHLRAATAECVNAHLRNRGMRALPVRGAQKAYACALWQVLAHNLMRVAVLRVPVSA